VQPEDVGLRLASRESAHCMRSLSGAANAGDGNAIPEHVIDSLAQVDQLPLP